VPRLIEEQLRGDLGGALGLGQEPRAPELAHVLEQREVVAAEWLRAGVEQREGSDRGAVDQHGDPGEEPDAAGPGQGGEGGVRVGVRNKE
jgi:hypothetical protein